MRKQISGVGTRVVVTVILLVLLLIPAIFVTAIACDTPAGLITISGSTTVQPISEQLGKKFMAENPRVSVVVTGGGSGVGIKDVSNGKVDIGASSRELTGADPVVIKYLLGRDAIAVIVNRANPVTGLSTLQVREVFAGAISDWHDVGGQSGNIHVIVRIEGSGTRTSFQELVMGTAKIIGTASIQESNELVRGAVAMDARAIGFISLGYVSPSIKALSVDTVPCTIDNARNGTYPIVRPLYYLTRSQAEGLVKKYIDFCLAPDSQKAVASEGYLPAE